MFTSRIMLISQKQPKNLYIFYVIQTKINVGSLRKAMNVAIASDHAGFELKQLIIEHFDSVNFADMGAYSEASCDYPDYISKAALKVRDGQTDFGIAICGTGIGASITANKIRGIRAALCFNEFMAEKSREHNNANMLILGARIIGADLAFAIVHRWLDSSFEGGRHQRRIEKITAIENAEVSSAQQLNGKIQ